MYIFLEGSPVSIPGLIFADPLMCTVAPDSCEVEVIRRIGRVQDAGRMCRHQGGVLPQRVVLLPVDTGE